MNQYNLKTGSAKSPLNVYVVTDWHERIFTRHIPGGGHEWDGVRFSFGLCPPPPQADALIVYPYPRWSIRTNLPKERTAFVGNEPEVIRRYKDAYLNQFGKVVISGRRTLSTQRLQESPALDWHVGIDHADPAAAIGIDDIASWPDDGKDDRISIVTSGKTGLPFYDLRLAFIEHLKKAIPDRIVIYGKDSFPVADKKEGLLPHRYHLALENNDDPWSWTEKLADPLLSWAFPFYVGCSNVEEELPVGSFLRIDPRDHEGSVKMMVNAIENDLWTKRHAVIAAARHEILYRHNIMAQFVRIVRSMNWEGWSSQKSILIRSERSLPPERGCFGSWPETIFRRALLKINPDLELRRARWRVRRKTTRMSLGQTIGKF
ncbi:MAG: hypothetical protein OXC25_00015 [Thiotrichales bacterium]|nr:hypothetical protein [Thiotrichales bacterium]